MNAQPRDVTYRQSAGVTVAVVDSGIASIPALGGSVWWSRSRSFVPGQTFTDAYGRGAQMALMIHRGAPTARLLALKVLDDDGGGSDAAAAKAIRYAVNHGARTVNLSVASNAPEPKLRSAIEFAAGHGTLVVVAAGNDGSDTDKFASYPASYRLPNMISVAATDGNGQFAANSDWGHRSITIGAWGLDVPTQDTTGTPTTISGTSAAAASLAKKPRISVNRLRQVLLATADPAPGLKGLTASGR